MKTKQTIVMLLVALLGLSSCNDFLDITPTGKVIAKTGKEYRALLTYEYKYFPEDRGLATLRSDEVVMDNTTATDDYNSYFDIWAWNDTERQGTTSSFGWRRYYHAIYIANYIMEHQKEITEASQEEINQMVGEAYMMRAYCHFLLVNLYAAPYTHCTPSTTRGIPLSVKADVNAVLKCSSVEQVYKQVLDDIADAKKLLNVKTWESGLKYRFNTVSADALQARVCLYKGDWQRALDAAKDVIAEHGDLEDLTQSSGYKLPNDYQSVENILALEQVMTSSYVRIGSPAPTLVAKYGSGDQRKRKYFRQETLTRSSLLKGGSNQYSCSFRSAEAYLTAAEASAELDDLRGARSYLLTLAAKRYSATRLATYTSELEAMDKASLLQAIYDERERELAFEGHRWFDLRRTTQPSLVKTYNGTTYTLDDGDSRYTLRFPSEAVEANPGIEQWNNE